MKSVWINNLSKEYTPDLARAFQARRWHTEQLSETEIINDLLFEIRETPNLVVVNTAGRALGSELASDARTVMSLTQEKKIPLVWLMWDSLNFDPALAGFEQQAYATSLGLPLVKPMVFPYADNLYVFTVSKEAVPFLKGAHVEYMPFGVNTDRFRPMALPKKYPVGFIGTSLIGNRNDGYYAMEKAGLTPPIDLKDAATNRTWEILCNFRTSALERLRACSILKADVWGSGWESVASQQLINYHGKADWATDLPTVINSISVNLNISKTCFPNDIAPRVLEILACGGICISNRLPGLEETFGEVLTFFDDPEELPELVAKAQEKGGRQFIMNGWKWTDRVARILTVTGA